MLFLVVQLFNFPSGFVFCVSSYSVFPLTLKHLVIGALQDRHNINKVRLDLIKSGSLPACLHHTHTVFVFTCQCAFKLVTLLIKRS